jgi:carboxypeptidase family protein
MATVKRTQTIKAALLGLLIAFSPQGVHAQAEGSASLMGTVFDSTSMAVLGGARVAVIGTNASTDANDRGEFRLEGIPAGTHWVSFFHPRLQALGVSPPSRQVSFVEGQERRIELAVPSEVTLLLGWCLVEQPGPGYGVLAGIVTDSLTGVAMPRAVVTATPTRRVPGTVPVEVRTDDSGYFRMCAVPGATELRVQAHFGNSSGRSIVTSVQPGSARMQDLMLLMSQEGTLSGYVRDYFSGEPVPGATVRVAGTSSSTLTDSEGRFIMDDLPPGRHLVTTDHLAFEERTDSVTIFSQEIVDIEVHLAQEALEVEGLVVTARTRFGRTSLAGDAKRADYISREEIEALLPRATATADLLRSVNAPGLRIRDIYTRDELTGVTTPSLCIEVSRRSGGEGCMPAAVFINGVAVPFPDQVIRDLDPNVIDHIEILSPIDASFQFGSMAGNGAIVIYTR